MSVERIAPHRRAEAAQAAVLCALLVGERAEFADRLAALTSSRVVGERTQRHRVLQRELVAAQIRELDRQVDALHARFPEIVE